jgi:hypothetical protein
MFRSELDCQGRRSQDHHFELASSLRETMWPLAQTAVAVSLSYLLAALHHGHGDGRGFRFYRLLDGGGAGY